MKHIVWVFFIAGLSIVMGACSDSGASDDGDEMMSDGDADADADTDADSDTDTDADTDTDSDRDSDTDSDADTETDIDGPCTASQETDTNLFWGTTGPYEVVVETNADAGINEGTIYRPADLSGGERFPIYVWGEGGCSLDGESNSAALGEIASHGYFVIADGTPGSSDNRPMGGDIVAMGEPLLAYVTWAISENNKPCSAYYHKLDTSKVASNGFSCGGLMSIGVSGDPRLTTWGYNSSGMFMENAAIYDAVHTPVLIVEGGLSEMGDPGATAYDNGLRDYAALSSRGVPIMFFSKDLGHGGDLFTQYGGDFNRINLAWLNWWLKGDESATGQGHLIGADCPYCSDIAWETMSANIP